MHASSMRELLLGSPRAPRAWSVVEHYTTPVAKDRAPVFVADDVEGWLLPDGARHNGLLVKRPFHGRWDGLQPDIDGALARWRKAGAAHSTVCAQVDNAGEHRASALDASVDALLDAAALPAALTAQLHEDACRIGRVVGELCDFAPILEMKLEIFGENSCSRWHQDYYAGRAIVTYSGAVGTEYTSDANVDFWELEHCGNNQCIIRDETEVKGVAPGDVLFMKGKRYPGVGASALVHKSPEKRYHPDGRVVNRLVLKIDVPPPGARQPVAGVRFE